MFYSKRIAAATLFGSLQLPAVLCRALSYFRHEVRILIYHRVVDLGRVYDKENVSASPEQFDRQLDHIKRHYDVISFVDLIAAYSGARALPQRPLLITFDDGFTDNYTYAYPALAARNMSAAFFVTTDNIGKKELFWFDQVGFLVKHAREKSWTLLDDTVVDLADQDRDSVLRQLLARLKTFPDDQRTKQIKILEDMTLDGTEEIDEINYPMTWDQLREMANNGMEIYSHTCSHPILSTLNYEEHIRRELLVSKQKIEEEIGQACNVFAYPVGRKSSYDQRVLRLLKECGYDIACINETGTVNVNDDNKLELCRVPVDHFQNFQSFKSIVAQPHWFSY